MDNFHEISDVGCCSYRGICDNQCACPLMGFVNDLSVLDGLFKTFSFALSLGSVVVRAFCCLIGLRHILTPQRTNIALQADTVFFIPSSSTVNVSVVDSMNGYGPNYMVRSCLVCNFRCGLLSHPVDEDRLTR